MEFLALHTGVSTVHWEDNEICIYVVEDKMFTPIVKKLIFLFVFYHNNFTMLFLLPNMITIMPYRYICATNHVQVQVLVGVLNG